MTRTSRSASTTLSLAAVFVAILASVACASGTRGPEAAPSLEAAPSRFTTLAGNRIVEKPQEFNAAVLEFLERQKLLGG
jgi:hypothetical protein